jgi:hypothetical protein
MQVKLECNVCNTSFFRIFAEHQRNLKLQRKPYCSRKCLGKGKTAKLTQRCNCANCGSAIVKNKSVVNESKTKRFFCTKNCAASYNNRHKTFGTRRSKLEQWLEVQLTNLYPSLEILYNDVSTINAELDLYIPSLNLAFELNGIFHYEPIFGENRLQNIKSNDNRKFQACLEQNIELCIINTSSQKYVKPSTSEKFLHIIKNIIEQKLAK